MTIRFESTKNFEKELNKFSLKEKNRIILNLNQYSLLLESKSEDFYKHTYQPLRLKLVDGNESSLYALIVNQDTRIIMTVDEDPLFEQILITLLHVVQHSDLAKAFKGIAELIYQNTLNDDVNEIIDNGANQSIAR